MTTSLNSSRCHTGIPGLDHILGGGLPRNHLYLVQGDPGAGKTTLGLQFLLEGIRAGETGLYITLSETLSELRGVAESHGWNLDTLSIFELSAIEQQLEDAQQNTFFHPAEVELNKTTKVLTDEVERVKPLRVVFDSLSEMRLLAENPLRYRRQMLALKQFFAGRNSTILLLDDRSSNAGDLQIQSIAHGVLTLERAPVNFGPHRRRLEMTKLRGAKFVEGLHDYVICSGGIRVFPRLIASEHHANFEQTSASSGLPGFDAMLGGGLDRGTSNLFLGPAGTGKSLMALQQVLAAAQRGERCALFLFDENLKILRTRITRLGMPLGPFIESGQVHVQQIDPAEVTPGEFASIVKDVVENNGVSVVVIDSLNGYLNAMPDERFLSLQLHEMLTFLSQRGVISILTVAQHGVISHMQAPVDVTYLADTVLVLRYFEVMGAIKKAISVIKKRTGRHESTIREYVIDKTGIALGEPLFDFSGVLSGTPVFHGQKDPISTPDRE